MKKALLLLFIVSFLLILSQFAFAAGYQSSFGVMPHGGYTISSNKCKICHAVHGTGQGSYHLLSKRVATLDWGGCEQCHSEASSFSAPVVYSMAGAKGEHRINGFAWIIPDSTKTLKLIDYTPGLDPSNETIAKYTPIPEHYINGKPVSSLRCLHCHSPHGNGVMGGGKILRSDPARDGGQAQTLSQFCGDCHDKNYVSWYNGRSHPMTSPTSRNIAWNNSTTCVQCHRAATLANGGQFPHQSIGVSLLKADYDGSNIDTVCLDCHRSPSGLDGVGFDF